MQGWKGSGKRLPLCEPLDLNLYTAGAEITAGLKTLPLTLEEARKEATHSGLIRRYLPQLLD